LKQRDDNGDETKSAKPKPTINQFQSFEMSEINPMRRGTHGNKWKDKRAKIE
jgi:hypothetical protein